MSNRQCVSPAAVRRVGVALAVLALAGCGALLTSQYRMVRAQREMKAGQWQRAAFDLRVVLHKHPRNAQAWLLLAKLSLSAGDVNGAQSALEHAVATGARGERIDILRARTWLAADQPKKLLDALAHGTVQLPEPQRTLLNAQALRLSGQIQPAIALLRPLIAREPQLTEARDALAESLALDGQFAAALGELATAIQRDPSSPEPPLTQARIDAAYGQFPAAKLAAHAALKRMAPGEPSRHRVEAWVLLVDSQLALGQVEPASRSLSALAQIAPGAPVTVLLQARLMLARGALEPAISALERVVASVPRYVQARTLLGATLLQHGDLQQAQQQLQQVLAEAPENIQARKLLADVQLKLGEPGEAMGVLGPALSAPQLDPGVLSLLGTAARRSEDTQLLVKELERSARQQPHNPKVITNLAAVYLSIGQAARALALLETLPESASPNRDRLWLQALLAARGVGAADAGVEQMLTAHPHDPGILVLGAAYLVSRQEPARAEPLLREALAIRPDDLEALVALAQVEEASGRAAAAEQRLRAALTAHPDVLPVRIALADALARDHALPQARKVLEAAPDAARQRSIQFALARLALAQGQLTEANAALDRAIATQPGSTALIEQAGLLLLAANQGHAALARLARAAALEPGNAVYWLNAARAQIAVNQPFAARASLEKADRLQPQWLPAVSLLAFLDVHQGKARAGLARIEAFLAHDPHEPHALVMKGDLESDLGQPAAAVAAYTAAQQVRPSGIVAVKEYQAELAAHAADPAGPLRQWLAQWPDDWRVRTVLGDYDLDVIHDPRQGIAEFNRAVAANPRDVAALNNLAWAMSQSGDPRAQAFAERAYRLAPLLAPVNDTLGWILARKHLGEQAVGYLARAVRLDPHNSDMQYHYAYALSETGQRDKARAILTRILADPAPFDSRRAALRLLATLKA